LGGNFFETQYIYGSGFYSKEKTNPVLFYSINNNSTADSLIPRFSYRVKFRRVLDV